MRKWWQKHDPNKGGWNEVAKGVQWSDYVEKSQGRKGEAQNYCVRRGGIDWI